MHRTTTEQGILRPEETSRRIDLLRYPADPHIGRFVERFWAVHWDLADPYDVRLVPHPCVNVTFTPGIGGQVHGVGTTPSTHPLQGKGVVFGVKFRPGGFAGFTGTPPAVMVDESRPLNTVFGPRAAELSASVLRAGSDHERVNVLRAFLHDRLPTGPDDHYDLVLRAVSVMLDDRTVVRVDDVAKRLGLTVRSLQRLFRTYVGVSPKWVLRRYRMHDGAHRLAAGDEPATVAAELGWFDQAHFTREFTALIGVSPAAYAKANKGASTPISSP